MGEGEALVPKGARTLGGLGAIDPSYAGWVRGGGGSLPQRVWRVSTHCAGDLGGRRPLSGGPGGPVAPHDQRRIILAQS